MYGILNNSISNLFNKTIRPETMLPPNHKCNESNCNGPRYAGCSFVCSRCLMPKFIDCISDRPEISHLLQLLQIKPDVLSTQTIINENKEKISELFNTESILNFICPLCMEDGTIFEIKKKFNESDTKQKSKINELKKQIRELNNDKNRMNDENKKLVSDIAILEEKQKDLTKKNEQLKQDVSHNVDDNEGQCAKCSELRSENFHLGESMATLTNKITELSEASLFYITTEINQMIEKQNDLSTQFKKSQSEIAEKLKSLSLDIENRDTNDSDAAGRSSQNNQHMNSGMNPHSKTFISNESRADNHTKGDELPVNKKHITRDENGNFLPPRSKTFLLDKNENDAKTFDIHVSPFDTDITSDEIVAHILNKTDIQDANLFIVEKLVGKREEIQRKTFVSFKISTSHQNIFNTLMNKSVWGPNQSPRLFDDKKLKRRDGRSSFANNRGRENYGYRSRYGQQPQNSFPNGQNRQSKGFYSSPKYDHRFSDNNQRNYPRSQYQMRNNNSDPMYGNDDRQIPYTIPPRFQNRTTPRYYPQQSQQSHRQYYDNRTGESGRRYYPHQSQQSHRQHFDQKTRRNYDRSNSYRNDAREQFNGYSQFNSNDNHLQLRQRKNSYQQSFLDPNEYANQPNFYQMNNSNRQYGSMNSIYRI